MKKYKYIIIGGGQAGGSALDAIRQLDSDGAAILVTQEPHRPYQRPPLSKEMLLGKSGREKVFLESEEYYRSNNIDLIVGSRASKLHPDTKIVELDDGHTLEYEKLLLATGGRAKRLSLPGNDLQGVFVLRTIEDSENINHAADTGKKALVLGGGFIGSEVASSLSQLGVGVTMVFPGSRLLESVVPRELSKLLQGIFADHGVRILPETTAEKLEGSKAVERAVLDNGQILDVDFVVMGVGISLNTSLAQEAGLAVRKEDGAIMVDETLRTSDPHIFAAGDIAGWPDPTFGQRLQVEHWDVARRQGLRAGRNMAGDVKPYTTLPYFFSDLFDLSFEAWGNFSSWDRTVLRGSLKNKSFAFYYFDKDRLTGVLSVGRPDEERDPMQSLVKARSKYDVISYRLQDESVELTELLDAE